MATFIRVKDDITGDEYDIDPASLRSGLTILEDYPSVTGDGAQPRPAKVHVDKAGNRIPLKIPAAPKEPEAKPEPESTAPAQPADIKE